MKMKRQVGRTVLTYLSDLVLVSVGVCGIVVPLLSEQAFGGEVAAEVSYEDVKPIIFRSCKKCHNPEKHKGDLVLTEFPFLYEEDDFDSISEVIETIVYKINSPARKPMPPANADVPPLTDEDKALFDQWLSQLQSTSVN